MKQRLHHPRLNMVRIGYKIHPAQLVLLCKTNYHQPSIREVARNPKEEVNPFNYSKAKKIVNEIAIKLCLN